MKNTALPDNTHLAPWPIFHVVTEPDCTLKLYCDISEVPSLHPSHHVESHVWKEQDVSCRQLSECLVQEYP